MFSNDNRRILLVQTHNRRWQPAGGEWRFLVQTAEGETLIDAGDLEPRVAGERLGLLTVVRGLEALEQESCVTLVTDERYVIRGMRYGLEEWREQDWKWQRFGDLVEITNADLWRRLDNALGYHQLQCRYFRCDASHAANTGHASDTRHVPQPHFARRRRGRIVVPQDSVPNELPIAVAPPKMLDRNWVPAASKLAMELAQRWGIGYSAQDIPSPRPAVSAALAAI